MGKNLREESKKGWESAEHTPDLNELKLGCLLRIADHVETMAQNHNNLISDRNWYKSRSEEKDVRIAKLQRTITAYRGHLNRRKNESKKTREPSRKTRSR